MRKRQGYKEMIKHELRLPPELMRQNGHPGSHGPQGNGRSRFTGKGPIEEKAAELEAAPEGGFMASDEIRKCRSSISKLIKDWNFRDAMLECTKAQKRMADGPGKQGFFKEAWQQVLSVINKRRPDGGNGGSAWMLKAYLEECQGNCDAAANSYAMAAEKYGDYDCGVPADRARCEAERLINEKHLKRPASGAASREETEILRGIIYSGVRYEAGPTAEPDTSKKSFLTAELPNHRKKKPKPKEEKPPTIHYEGPWWSRPW